MTTFDPPDSWVAPDWHPDFGDAKAELDYLRSLANTVLQAVVSVSVGLELPEPGLMYLVIRRHSNRLAEVYSVRGIDDREQRRYGVFLFPDSPNEKEYYTESPIEVANLINAEATMTRGDKDKGK